MTQEEEILGSTDAMAHPLIPLGIRPSVAGAEAGVMAVVPMAEDVTSRGLMNLLTNLLQK